MIDNIDSKMATAKLIEAYEAECKDAFAKMKPIVDDPSWQVSKQETAITLCTRSDGSSRYLQTKSIVFIPCQTSDVVNLALFSPKIDESTPDSERHGIKERAVLYEENEAERRAIIFVGMDSPTRLASPRSFLIYRRIFKEDSRTFIFHMSISNKELCPETSKYVRGQLFFQCYIIEPEGENQTKLTFLFHADPKGSIPPFAYNMVAAEQGRTSERMREELIKHGK